jgi:hypothetical protein
LNLQRLKFKLGEVHGFTIAGVLPTVTTPFGPITCSNRITIIDKEFR